MGLEKTYTNYTFTAFLFSEKNISDGVFMNEVRNFDKKFRISLLKRAFEMLFVVRRRNLSQLAVVIHGKNQSK